MTLGDLIRTPSTVVSFNSIGGTLGSTGPNSGQIWLGTLHSGSLPVNLVDRSLISSWAVAGVSASGAEFAGYSVTLGVGTLSSAPNGAFGSYDQTIVTTGSVLSPNSSQNIKLLTSAFIADGGTYVNSLNLSGAGSDLSFNNTNAGTLLVVSGGILKSGGSSSIGTSGVRGTLSSGVPRPNDSSELLLTVAPSSALTVYSKMDDNSASATTNLVISGGGTVTLAAGGSNTYSGVTVINGANVNTAGAVASVYVIPGALILNGGALTLNAGSQLNSAAPIYINASGSLSFSGIYSSTFNRTITFNNSGGNTNPTLITGGSLIFGGTVAFDSTNDSFSTVPTISSSSANGGTLYLGEVNNTISTSGLSPLGLVINTPVINGALTKTGIGMLSLNSQLSTFSGGLTISRGGVIAGTSSLVSGGSFVSGPFGLGPVWMADNSANLIGVATAIYTTRLANYSAPTLPAYYDGTVAPLDMGPILESVHKTSRLLIAHEAVVPFGIGAEIARRLKETPEVVHCIESHHGEVEIGRAHV